MNATMMNPSKLNGINFITQGDGPPVVLIHGMGASLRNWDFLSHDLVSCGFQAYAIDLPGHGDSVKWQDAQDYHINQFNKTFREWIHAALDDRQIILIGHSLGAYLSVQYTLNQPERVRSLVLVDPFLSTDQLSPFLRFGLKHPDISANVLGRTPPWVVQPIVNLNRNISANLPSTIRNQMANDYKRATPLIVHITPTVDNLENRLNEIIHPTLVTWGEKDRTLSTHSFEAAVQKLPNGQGHPFPGIGHIPHLCAVPEFNRIVVDFISSQN